MSILDKVADAREARALFSSRQSLVMLEDCFVVAVIIDMVNMAMASEWWQ